MVFFGLTLGIIEFGRVLWIANSLHMAVQQAARCGAIGSSACSNVPNFAASVAGSGIPSSAFSAGTATCN
jgi:Flp pilus assembly protein TadG